MAFAHPEFLVETDWLADHLDDDNLRILDVTGMLTRTFVNLARERCYDAGHIPNAVFFDSAAGHGELSDPDAPLPWTWPSPERFAATMGRHGIGNRTRVVLVARTPRAGIDEGTGWCTRAWWTMHHFGADCAVLRGGVEKWEAEGRPLVTDVPTVAPATFVVAPGWQRGLASRHDVLAALADGSSCVVDALRPASFDGTAPGYGPRKGHITGAVNVPAFDLIEGETAGFAAPDAVASILSAHGLLQRDRIITYCGGAIAATIDAFALALCGHDNVAVYDGSLMEWAADPALPMTDPAGG